MCMCRNYKCKFCYIFKFFLHNIYFLCVFFTWIYYSREEQIKPLTIPMYVSSKTERVEKAHSKKKIPLSCSLHTMSRWLWRSMGDGRRMKIMGKKLFTQISLSSAWMFWIGELSMNSCKTVWWIFNPIKFEMRLSILAQENM